MAEAADQMIIYQARGLHECIANGGTHKRKSSRFEITAERIRFPAARGNVTMPSAMMDDGLAVDEAPEILIEAAEFLLHLQEGCGIADRGLNLQPIADNTSILKQPTHVTGIKSSNFLGIKLGKSPAIRLTLLQNGFPTQSGLGPIEHNELKELLILVQRHTPFTIMIGNA